MAPPPSTPTPPDLHVVTCKYFTPEPKDEPRPQKSDRDPEAEMLRWLDLSG
jgi:hypothetical protein